MNQSEFENGIGVDLSYIPCKLKAKWFREVEMYYMNKCDNGSKEQAYKHFRSEIRTRVRELKEFRFASNLELQACISLALKRLDKEFKHVGAAARHDWAAHLSEVVGSDEQDQYYSEINDAVQAIRKRLAEGEYCVEAGLDVIENYTERLINAVRNFARFTGYETEYSHDRENKEVALAIVLYLMSEHYPAFYEVHQQSVVCYNRFNKFSCAWD